MSSKNDSTWSANLVIDYTKPGPYYQELHFDSVPEYRSAKAKVLAYYLPQFYPFPENDDWWGKGFTEWRNVTRGLPRFLGHYQPHLPSDLGFYDLRVKEVIEQQVAYAKSAGIYGFCYYYYWFNGKRLLDKPLDLLLESKDIEMPFCLIWANENWTRTWDGFDTDVLIAQDYDNQSDEAFVKELERYIKDDRYIRISGRPLFFIYRPGTIPGFKQKLVSWRKLFNDLLGESPLIYMAQGFDDYDPGDYGLDGAIEFPPHKVAVDLENKVSSLPGLAAHFKGHYPSYDDVVERSKEDDDPGYDLIKGVFPMWDNEARLPNRGMGFIGSTPDKYEQWCQQAIEYACHHPIQGSEHFVVVNAWNEWAEGAHLEPDVYHGAAYLNATFRAVFDIKQSQSAFKLILVGHDAHNHGAQLLMLNILKTLTAEFGIRVELYLLNGGDLVREYRKYSHVYVLDDDLNALRYYLDQNDNATVAKYALCNTTVTGSCVEILKSCDYTVINLIHELSHIIESMGIEQSALATATHSDRLIFPCEFVKDSFETVLQRSITAYKLRPQGLYQSVNRVADAKQQLCQLLNIPTDVNLVLNLGYGDSRKGFDYFIEIARKTALIDPSYQFIWVGNVSDDMRHLLSKSGSVTAIIHTIDYVEDVSLYLRGSDAYALTSREDPFPSVVLEALSVGLPVVAFEGSGGAAEILADSANGQCVEMSNTKAFAQTLIAQVSNDDEAKKQQRQALIRKDYGWKDYVFDLLNDFATTYRKVSVIIPNYNYSDYLYERLGSIFRQEYPIFEIIVLDDHSDDDSIAVIKEIAHYYRREITLIENDTNSGSAFRQWHKGVAQASGDYVWIAEADDVASDQFLSAIFARQNDFSMAYTDSQQIDENGAFLANNYRYYYDEIFKAQLDSGDLLAGPEVARSLCEKNQFMNVSSVLFKRDSLWPVLDQQLDVISQYRVAGDWFVYLTILAQAHSTCLLVKDSLNQHRRHSEGITIANEEINRQEIQRIHSYIKNSLPQLNSD